MGVDEMGYKLWYSGLRRIEIVDRGKKNKRYWWVVVMMVLNECDKGSVMGIGMRKGRPY